MAEYAAILFSMILVNNYVLVKFLGICPFLGVSKKLDSAAGMGCAVTVVMVLATAVTWPLQQLLNALGLGYLQTIAFILVIAVLVQMLEIVIRYFLPALHEALGVYLPLITTNCAVLGVTILAVDEGYNYPEALVAALGAGLGFCWRWCCSAACVGAWTRPSAQAFKGMPITLISAALVSLSFMCFAGVADNLFGVL